MWDNKRKNKSEALTTYIGSDAVVVGDIQFAAGLHVEGVIKGDVTADNSDRAIVTIGKNAVVEGSVRAPRVILNGMVNGDIHAGQAIELAENARVTGNIYYQRLEMAMGAEVNGQLIHEEGRGKKEEAGTVPEDLVDTST